MSGEEFLPKGFKVVVKKSENGRERKTYKGPGGGIYRSLVDIKQRYNPISNATNMKCENNINLGKNMSNPGLIDNNRNKTNLCRSDNTLSNKRQSKSIRLQKSTKSTIGQNNTSATVSQNQTRASVSQAAARASNSQAAARASVSQAAARASASQTPQRGSQSVVESLLSFISSCLVEEAVVTALGRRQTCFRCNLCSYGHTSKWEVENHIENLHSRVRASYECDLCGYTANTRAAYYSHGRTKHGVGQEVTID